MSRHDLQPRPDVLHVVRACVGWDRPLQTFFAQVFARGENDEEDVFLWVGTDLGEVPSAEAVIEVVTPYTIVPDTLVATLNAERDASIGIKDQRFQAEVTRGLFGSRH